MFIDSLLALPSTASGDTEVAAPTDPGKTDFLVFPEPEPQWRPTQGPALVWPFGKLDSGCVEVRGGVVPDKRDSAVWRMADSTQVYGLLVVPVIPGGTGCADVAPPP